MGFYSYPDFPGASYDHWKTTPPNSWDEPDEPTPEEEAEEWYWDWAGDWYHARLDDGYDLSLDEQSRVDTAEPHSTTTGRAA